VVVVLTEVARQYALAVGSGLVFLFGSQFRYAMCQAIPWTYNMRKNVVFDCWYKKLLEVRFFPPFLLSRD